MPNVNNFKLALDTIAPAGSFVTPASDATAVVMGTITAELNLDGASYMKVWSTASNASVTAVPEGLSWIPASTTHTINFSPEGDYKLHAVFMDEVGNESAIAHSGLIRSDTTAPAITEFYFYDITNTGTAQNPVYDHSYSNDRTVGVHIQASDSFSGLNRVVITCDDLENSPITISGTNFNSTTHIYDSMGNGTSTNHLHFDSNATDGTKTITITAYDLAGNSSTTTCQIYLDTAISAVTTTLKANASDTNDLIQWVNEDTNSFVAIISTADTDIVGYQITGDINNPTASGTWDTWPQTSTPTTSITVTGLAFTTGDGTKSVNVILKDRSGNTASAPVVTRILDTQEPTVTISTNHSWIAAGAGTTNDATITYTCSDGAGTVSGIASGSPSFSYKKGENGTWRSLTGISGGSFTFNASRLVEADLSPNAGGVYYLKIEATDQAGNSNSATCTLQIEAGFSIDSLTLNGYALYANYYNDATDDRLTVTVNNSTAPGSGRANLQVWTNTTQNSEEPTAGTNSIGWTSAAQQVPSASINKGYSESAGNWLHVKATSQVGNVAYKHISFVCDYTAPTFDASIATSVPTHGRQVQISISNFADNLDTQNSTTVDALKISAADGTTFASGTQDWTAAAEGTYTLELASNLNAGNYGVVIQLRDKSNNIRTIPLSWEFDDIPPSATMSLKESDGSSAKASVSAVNTFKVNVVWTSDSTDTIDPSTSTSTIWYKLWGDFSTTNGGAQVTSTNAQWVQMTATSITTDVFYCTANSGSNQNGDTKTIYGKVKDDAGNESDIPAVSFIYNPSAAVLNITNITQERVSCVHEPRKQVTSGVVTNLSDYADLMSFTVTSSQSLTELKVAAYLDGHYPNENTAGSAITAELLVNGANSRGQNYHPVGSVASPVANPITVVVDGKDYRTALGGSEQNNVDGTHYIVVFGKNNAGLWSVAGIACDASSNNSGN